MYLLYTYILLVSYAFILVYSLLTKYYGDGVKEKGINGLWCVWDRRNMYTSSYRAVNALRPGYKNQSVNTVQVNNHTLF
jgi:hypothetical protein